jgi:MFS family permease
MRRVRPILGLFQRYPDFTRLYAALLVGFAADWFATVALVGLVLETTDSAVAAALILVLQSAPFLLATPVAGMLADRLDRRKLLVTASVARGLVCFGLLLAVDADTIWIAFAVVAMLSLSAAFFEPTVSASLPNLVDPDDLPTANALLAAAWGTMVAVGAAAGREATFMVYPLLFFVAAALTWTVRRSLRESDIPPTAEDAPLGLRGLRSTLGVTWELARGDRAISSLLITKVTFGVAVGIIGMLAITSDQIWGAGELGVGLLFAARGLGALVGPFAARRYATDDRGRILRGIGIALLVFFIGYALLPLSPGIVVAAFFVFVGHLGGGAQWTLSTFGLQRAAPDRIRGRVLSVDFGMALAASSLSTLLAGWLAGVIGPLPTLYVMLSLLGLSGGVWFVWTRPIRSQAAALEPSPQSVEVAG